jgi:membrane associated rhomboid family serine protease
VSAAGEPAPAPPEPPRGPPDPPRVTPLDPGPRPLAEGERAPSRDAPRGADLPSAAREKTPLADVLVASIACVHLYLFAEGRDLSARPLSGWDLLLSVELETLLRAGALAPDLVRRGEWWRILASPLLHVNLVHVGIALLFVRSVGRDVERLLGRGALFLGLLGGALATAAHALATDTLAIGAFGPACGAAGVLVTGLRPPAIPPSVVREVRGRILFSVLAFVVLGWLVSAGLRAAGVPLTIDNTALLAGLAGGMAAGLALPAPFVPRPLLPPWRRAVHGAALALAVASTLVMGLTGSRGLLRLVFPSSGGGPGSERLERLRAGRPGAGGGDPRAYLVPGLAGAPLEPRVVEDLGVTLALPSAWERLDKKKGRAAFGPAPGAPFVQVHAIEAPPGAIGPDYGDPYVVVDMLRGEYEAGGAEGVLAAPFARRRLGGLEAVRIDFRYRMHGNELQEIRYVARGRARVYFVTFAGLAGAAEALEERLAGEVRFREAE